MQFAQHMHWTRAEFLALTELGIMRCNEAMADNG